MAQELKAFKLGSVELGEYWAYDAEEVDAVLAEKDKEIRKLKDSLGKLLKAKTEQIMDEVIQKTLIYGEGFVPVEHAMKLVAETRHHKYKRCFKMSRWCVSMMVFNSKYGTDKKWHHFKKWHKRWLELAEKFKEAK